MFKLILVAFTLAIILSVSNFIKPMQTMSKPIALVKYNDMVYHCEGVIKTDCGHSLHCGNMSVHCVTDMEVEYL